MNDEIQEEALKLFKLLKEKKLSLSCAESCTGGLFAAALTEIPGSSEVFDRGFVTYSEKAKQEELGVKKETLKKYSAVSFETAKEMALGVRKNSNSDLCLSVTGYAGPGGGTKEDPVGRFYIGIYYKESCSAYKFFIPKKSRREVRLNAVLTMLKIAEEFTSSKDLLFLEQCKELAR